MLKICLLTFAAVPFWGRPHIFLTGMKIINSKKTTRLRRFYQWLVL